MEQRYIISTPEEMFDLGVRLAGALKFSDIVLLKGGLGAGKTLLTKGVAGGLGFDVDEVTSPSFSLVNLYQTPRCNVYHIDLWRLDPENDPAALVGLYELIEEDDAIILIEWAERLGDDTKFHNRTITISIAGDGEIARDVTITTGEPINI